MLYLYTSISHRKGRDLCFCNSIVNKMGSWSRKVNCVALVGRSIHLHTYVYRPIRTYVYVYPSIFLYKNIFLILQYNRYLIYKTFILHKINKPSGSIKVETSISCPTFTHRIRHENKNVFTKDLRPNTLVLYTVYNGFMKVLIK